MPRHETKSTAFCFEGVQAISYIAVILVMLHTALEETNLEKAKGGAQFS